MDNKLKDLKEYEKKIREIKEILITNIVLVGQISSPTFFEGKRTNLILERMADFQVDECATDSYGNAIGIIRGTNSAKPPIFLVAHLDTFIETDTYHDYMVTKDAIKGPGVSDNSAAVGVMISFTEILKKLDLRFESDIVLIGPIHSLGKGNLQGIRSLLNTWSTPIRAAICLESVELGRLNYYSDGMIRCEVVCHISKTGVWETKFKPNAILIINEIINEILEMRLPQRPRSRVIVGKISGGYQHGKIAYEAKLGFEIQSKSDEMVEAIFNDIKDIIAGYSHEYGVELTINTISNIKATRLKYNHPLVKCVACIMEKLDIKPIAEPSESELSAFLSRGIPAVTLGITRGDNYHREDTKIEIEPMFKGIAQILGVMKAIDNGVCDEKHVA